MPVNSHEPWYKKEGRDEKITSLTRIPSVIPIYNGEEMACIMVRDPVPVESISMDAGAMLLRDASHPTMQLNVIVNHSNVKDIM